MSSISKIKSESTREKIKAAAAQIFVEKGYAAARMQEIADRAGANKAMIYYYFSSKDELFEAIIREAFEELFGMFSELFDLRENDPKVFIPRLVHMHFRFLLEHPHLPRMMARELNSGSPVPQKVLADMMHRSGKQKLSSLQHIFSRAVQDGKMRHIDIKHTLWSIIALNVFSFIAAPVLQNAWPEEFRSLDKLMKKREKAVVDLILNGLVPR
jgi:TetR/AcrR family transcriptional regulator